MTLANTDIRYGSVAKTFHWLTALLILTAIPLGVIANQLPYDTGEQLATKAWLFSLHKTVGVAAFLVALGRILWALTQPKPALLHPDRKLESFAAETVHWMLYASLLLVPLTGWIHHAAATGFAPIFWPFGQSLPFVPKDDGVAHTFASLHWVFTKVLAAAILLHIAGAVKHHVIDRDATLRRMWFGQTALPDLASARHPRSPIAAALVIWAGALALGLALGRDAEGAATPTLATVESGWDVTEGTVEITVLQLGSEVTGSFGEWTAAINFTPETGEGDVTATINVTSLTLGSVSSQALGPDFLDATNHPTATFTATIRPQPDELYVAEGTLALSGAEAPVSLLFDLNIDGDTAIMSGDTTLDRRNFGIGESFGDETQVGFSVTVSVDLTATRAEEAEQGQN